MVLDRDKKPGLTPQGAKIAPRSEFWRYFRDILRWPLIHSPGPLSALVQGQAHSLDETRDDIVYFREQWFPEHCEEVLIPGFGTSRGLVRLSFVRRSRGDDAKRNESVSPTLPAQGGARAAPAGGFRESAAQFRSRVVNAWRWHMLGGKVEGLPEILKFYGFESLKIESLRDYQPSRWAEFQIGLKMPSSQKEQETLLNDLDALIWLVNEYKPARSVLARIYTDTYNLNPAVWSGEKDAHGWSQGFWSRFSGVDYESPDNPGVVVSFGMAHRFQSEVWNVTGAGLGIENLTGIIAPYIDRPVWSRSAWSDVFPRNHGFTIGEILSLHWCVRTTSSYPWRGAWNARHWQENATWDRVLPPWRFRRRAWARVEAVFSWPGDGKEPDDPVQVHGDGTWGDVNACYGRPHAVIHEGTRWGDPWGADPGRQELEILERRQDKDSLSAPPVNPGIPQSAGHTRAACASAPLHERGWRGPWSGRGWLAERCPVVFAALRSMSAEHEDAGAPRLSRDALLAVPCAALSSPAPQWGGQNAAPQAGGPLHERRWLGSPAGRRWYDYTGTTSIKEQPE